MVLSFMIKLFVGNISRMAAENSPRLLPFEQKEALPIIVPDQEHRALTLNSSPPASGGENIFGLYFGKPAAGTGNSAGKLCW